jgi:4-hydroxythreonine-4-phosphate dehydrogenase
MAIAQVAHRWGEGAIVPRGTLVIRAHNNVPRETMYAQAMTKKHLPIAITMGDPAGIGPEIALKAACEYLGDSIIVGDKAFLQMEASRLNLAIPQRVALHQATTVSNTLVIGQIQASAGKNAHETIQAAVNLVTEGKASAIATGPIHKESLAAAGVPFPGHTEMLAHMAGLPSTDAVSMMLVNTELRVILVSIHVPLGSAIRLVTKENVLRTIARAHTAIKLAGITQPRIAVAGLNPHAGENGLFGSEDLEHIAPAIQEAKTLGINASGPFPPDTIFMRARGFKEFDIVVAQYHDQGLIPIKYMGLDEGVNVTVGLPFVRTSVDHGTAFDIAGRMHKGKGIASEASLLAAIRVAQDFTG